MSEGREGDLLSCWYHVSALSVKTVLPVLLSTEVRPITM